MEEPGACYRGAAVLVLTVAYDGSAYSGYARQRTPDGDDRVPTVQGELERALSLVLRRDVATVCAGRTDAGVHALGQQVGLEVSEEEAIELIGGDHAHFGHGLSGLVRSMNGLVPEDIAVTSARLEPAGFNPRFDCLSREYRYLISPGPIRPVLLRDHAWWTRFDLDVAAMRAAGACLVGEHDFRSFCSAAGAEEVSTTVREILALGIFPEDYLGEECLCVRVVGNAFLHNMVRIIVGTLVDVGRGHREPGWVADALAACDRKAAGQTAPACGLTLWKVLYPTTGDDPFHER